MKYTKTKIITLSLGVLLFNSCIVKSLFPFFTKDTVHFEESFLGIWKNAKNNDSRWIITSVKDIALFEKEKDSTPPSKKDLEFYDNYKDGYYAVYEEMDENKSSIFLAMPFKINNQLFLDFTPLFYDESNNNLLSHHLTPTHSLAKFDILEDNKIDIKWLASDKLVELIKENKIKIKHEKLTPSDEYLLTASSKELQKFIAKYMASNDTDKWKTDVKFNLKRSHSKEEAFNLIKRVINNEQKLSGDLF